MKWCWYLLDYKTTFDEQYLATMPCSCGSGLSSKYETRKQILVAASESNIIQAIGHYGTRRVKEDWPAAEKYMESLYAELARRAERSA